MRGFLVLLLACGKHDDPPPPPQPTPAAKPVPVDAAEFPAKCTVNSAMPVDHFATVQGQVSPSKDDTFPIDHDALVIDTGACKFAKQTYFQHMGSTWVLVHPLDDKRCEVWLGGETENPHYDGKPSGYCVFERGGVFRVPVSDAGGPPHVKCCP